MLFFGPAACATDAYSLPMAFVVQYRLLWPGRAGKPRTTMDARLELTLTLYGLDKFNEDVDAEIFARKLTAFLKGIRHSDMAANDGKRRHKLLLTELSKNTATASVREQVVVRGMSAESGLAFYSRAVEAVYNRRPEARTVPVNLLNDIVVLNNGAGHSFAFGEFKSNHGQIIRIDDFLEKAARSVMIERAKENQGESVPERGFTGIAYGSFDGTLLEVDSRGNVPRGKLILTAGGREVDCTLNALKTPERQAALESRVIAYGRAHYDGSSGLPVRLEVTKVDPVIAQLGADLAQWKGAFRIPENQAEDWD